MARTISVADDVFEWLKKEKGEKSYSELLRELRKNRSNFSGLNGANSLDAVSDNEIEDAVSAAEEDAVEDLEEKFA